MKKVIIPQEIMDRVVELQEELSAGRLSIDSPCGADPMIEILGGLHARVAINETKPGRFPSVEEELSLLERLIVLQARKK